MAGGTISRIMMPNSRLIAVALLATSAAALFGTATRAEPLEREECKALQSQKQALLTAGVKAALNRGPDWVKEHLHNEEEIEKVRQYLLVEEKVAFRCRTDGVRIPKPKPPPVPERKPPIPTYVVESGTPKILAGLAATAFLPLIITWLMNFTTVWLWYLGSGRISRLATIRRLGMSCSLASGFSPSWVRGLT